MKESSAFGQNDETPTAECSLEAHLLRLETSLLDPAVRRNREKVASLLTEDFREFGSSGKAWSRDEILYLLETEQYAAPVMEDFQCRELSDGVALVTYRTVRRDSSTGKCSEALRSSLWVYESGRWRMVFHQGTRVLDA
jgi:hypothetical protein